LAFDGERAINGNRRFLDVGLAAAIEILALLGSKEKSAQIFGRLCRGREGPKQSAD
jgi:hypothetical protein